MVVLFLLFLVVADKCLGQGNEGLFPQIPLCLINFSPRQLFSNSVEHCLHIRANERIALQCKISIREYRFTPLIFCDGNNESKSTE